MLYYLTLLSDQLGAFNVFRYITFRTGGAILTALFVVFIFGPYLIKALKSSQGKGQPIRDDGPERHIIEKQGTPTMGGLMILLGVFISTILWGDLSNLYVLLVLFVTISFGAIGFYDDYLKVSNSSSRGFSGKIKFLLEAAIAAIVAYIIIDVGEKPLSSSVTVPFLKDFIINFGMFYIAFAMIVIVGASNAVNLTDGLDGLAIVPVIIAIATFALIVYMAGHSQFSQYLQIKYIHNAGELAVFCGAVLGAGLGFLWFNAPPAMIFMGDTGSLSLGGAIGTIAVIAKHEIVLSIVGGLFVLEAISVIIQVASFKLTGKRIFRMAPIHHHFEKKGWAEPTIVIRFWIIAVVLALIGLGTMKIR